MNVLLISLIVGFVAVTRLTKLMVDDKIMVGYRRWIINRWGKDSMAAYWAHCPWCTSMWVSLLVMPVAAIWPNQWVIAGLAVPAGSMIAGLILDRE